MKKIRINSLLTLFYVAFSTVIFAEEVPQAQFEEYNLKNGLHIILHKDTNEPNVIVGMKYHVGSKNEVPNRTGFAHFFEHLLFHGTKNIPQGQFENIVMSAGGYCNAYTTYDVTYYYQLLPAHQYKLGLWLESERLLHPIITEEGIKREREIVKEEKRMRYGNSPLGYAYFDMMEVLYPFENYGHSIIGSMEDLDAASLDDFQTFFQKYYKPNNACLVVAGNIDLEETKKWIKYYFKDIPKGKKVERPHNFQARSLQKRIEKHPKGLKKPALALCYPVMPETDKDAPVIQLIATILSGNSSYSYFKQEAIKKDTLINGLKASAELYEKIGVLRLAGRMKDINSEEHLVETMKEQVKRLRNEPVSSHFLKQVVNEFESAYTDLYFHAESFADEITKYHHLYGSAEKFNDVITNFLKITPADIQRVAQKCLNDENCITTVYYPEKKTRK